MTSDLMVAEEALKHAAQRFRQAGIDTARLDARILLGHVLGKPPSTILPGDRSLVSRAQQEEYHGFVARREGFEPVSRIIGVREFFGRAFAIGPAVLDPRADSECVIELALEHTERPEQILDLGVGSGCLLITLLAELPDAVGVGVDRSTEAIAVAQENAIGMNLGDRCTLIESDWFSAVEGSFDLIISNPPYIPAGDLGGLMPDVRLHDPVLALDGGSDGLEPYRRIFGVAADFLKDDGTVVVEIGDGQADEVTEIARTAGFRATGRQKDLGDRTRGLAFTHPS